MILVRVVICRMEVLRAECEKWERLCFCIEKGRTLLERDCALISDVQIARSEAL